MTTMLATLMMEKPMNKGLASSFLFPENPMA